MTRAFNFSAGPAAIPLPVLEQVRNDIPDWQGTGMSVLEVSHRSTEFVALAERAEASLRQLLDVPDDYRVLFLQGGATLQFSMVALNLAADGAAADYVQTGSWSKKAIAEARRYCAVNIAADSADRNFSYIPRREDWQLDPQAAYVHYCANETIGGVEFAGVPDVGDVPLVADMSSNLLSRPLDVGKFGLVYAGAQKNIGPAGLTIVIVRSDLVGSARDITPTLLRYDTYADSGSMANTPPVFAWYVASLVFERLQAEGGLEAVAARNRRKADKLYRAIDDSGFYSNPVERDCRSLMNVPFVLADAGLDRRFLDEASAAGLKNLKGHRSVGGMRASLYNAVPEEAVDALIDFMSDFEKRCG